VQRRRVERRHAGDGGGGQDALAYFLLVDRYTRLPETAKDRPFDRAHSGAVA